MMEVENHQWILKLAGKHLMKNSTIYLVSKYLPYFNYRVKTFLSLEE